MDIKFIKSKGTWRDVADSARTTIGKDVGRGNPSFRWKKRMLLAEHSPIRQLSFKFKWIDLPYWVSTHFVRHWLGITHWVRTQRTDRTGVSRNELPQGAFVEHEFEANAQAMISISRKRLCNQASKETKEAWVKVINAIDDEVMPTVCVPDCIYRGHCYEYEPCGYSDTDEYKKALKRYRQLF